MTSDVLPIIDLRSLEDYQYAHLKEATHLPWPDIQQRQHELPARPAKLRLVGDEHYLADANAFLVSKGYEIVESLCSQTMESSLTEQGNYSRRLWQPCSLIAEFSKYANRKTVLDIGCGGGRDAVFLAEQGGQVTAIDKQMVVLDRAKRLADTHNVQVDFRCCDLTERTCLEDENFDVIVMIRYLNRNLFDWIKNHLKPNGHLIMQTFIEGVEPFGSPKNPSFILRSGELAKTFSDFKIIIDKIETLDDGRPVASFVAQKNKL